MNEELLSQGELATACKCSRRTLLRWLARLGIEPTAKEGGLNLYPREDVVRIQLAQLDATAKRADLVRANHWSKRRPNPTAERILTVGEAKRKARKGVAL